MSHLPLEPEKVYHLYTHANGSENLFRSDENYYYFLKKYREHIYPVVETLAYCLMPNHLHLMIQVRTEKELLEFGRSKKTTPGAYPYLTGFQNLSGMGMVLPRMVSQQFSNLFNAYTKAYNKKYKRMGALFCRPFRRKLVDNDDYFTTLMVYIHLNPIRHGFVKELPDWLHSSWHAYLLDKPTLLARDTGLGWFGNRQRFLEIHQALKKRDVTQNLSGFDDITVS